jgi:hypothetical protein
VEKNIIGKPGEEPKTVGRILKEKKTMATRWP